MKSARIPLRLCQGSVALAVLNALPVHATDWLSAPVDGHWENGANWSTGAAPSGATAVGNFGASGISSITVDSNVVVGTLRFDHAPSYTLTLGSNVLALQDGGIQMDSSAVPLLFISGGTIRFQNSAAAATALLDVDRGSIEFEDSASAAGAQLNLTQNGFVAFHGSSTASNASMADGGRIVFYDNSNAGNAHVDIGAGDAYFLNASSAQNATLINHGLLSFEDSSSAGNATIVNAANIGFQGSATAGNATILTLTGANTYFGGAATAGNAVLITQSGAITGFLFTQATAGSIEGAGDYDISGGTLTVGSLNTSTTVSGSIGGDEAGTLIKVGAGTLTLTGTNTYGGTVVEEGALRIGAGGTSGSIIGDVVNNATLIFSRSDNSIYKGAISGTGVVTKAGAGALTLTGASTYIGPTHIDGGLLVVNGSLASPVTAGTSGSLAGLGTINAPVNVLGTLIPGWPTVQPLTSRIGTLTVNGDLTLAAGSVFRIYAAANGSASRVNVIGATHTATINGATVDVVAANGTYAPSTSYTILNSAGGVGGTFSGVSTNLAFLDPSLSYDANNVYLTLTRNDVSFSSVAQTANEVSSASYLQALSTDSGAQPLVASLLNLSADSARTAFAQIGGDGLAGLGRISQLQTARFMDSLANHLDGGVPDDAYVPAGAAPNRGMWAHNFSSDGSVRGNGSTAATAWSGAGTAVGFDAPVNANALLGASFLYGRDDVEIDRRKSGVARIKAPQLVTYGSYGSADDLSTAWHLRGLLGYGQPTISSERRLTIGHGTSIARAIHDAREISVAGEAEMMRDIGALRLGGRVGLRASHLAEDGFIESGSTANLDIASRTTQSLTSSVGARASWSYRQDTQFDLRAVWSRELRSLASDLSGRLAASTSDARFTVGGVPVERDALTFGVGLSGNLRRNLAVCGDYSLELRGADVQRVGFARVRYVW